MEELKEKSVIELKAIVYDLLVKSQDINRELQVVNSLIAEKEKEVKE